MEIAVARDSPLGQYLAELDGEAGSEALAVGLLSASPSRAAPERPQRRQHAAAAFASLHRVYKSRASHVHLQSELRALETVYEVLDAAWASWREVYAVELLGVEPTHRRPLFLQLEPKGFRGVAVAVVTAMAAHSYISDGQTNGRQQLSGGSIDVDWRWLCLAVFGLIFGCGVAMELLFLLLVAHTMTQARRLQRTVVSFLAANERLERAFRSSLNLVKKAELARRGYRIGGGFLPPVGRLEKPTDRLQCVELRRLLRSLNDELTAHTNTGLGGQGKADRDNSLLDSMDSFSSGSTEDAAAPSLLVTSLSKRHAVAALAVENTLRSSLLALVSPLWGTHHGQAADSRRLIVRMDDCRRELERWQGRFQAWESALDRQTRRVSAEVRADTSSPSTETERRDQAAKASVLSPNDHPQLQQIEARLHELWSTSETLGSLVAAARHDLVAVDGTTDASSVGDASLSSEATVNRLASSRELMDKRVLELQAAWQAYDQALAAALSQSEPGDKRDSAPEPEEMNDDGKDKSALVQRVQTTERRDEDDCTFVFTGTSIGEKAFDLESILRRQQDASDAPGAGRHFVRELRDVLAYREATSRLRTITKDVDAADALTAAAARETIRAPLRALPDREPRAEMRPLDLRAALKSELQGLRLPFAAHDHDISDSDELSDGIE